MFITCPSCLKENLDSTVYCISCGTSVVTANSSTHHLPSGTLLRQQRYQIQSILGEGGFGITYKAIDLTAPINVAIKELWPEKAIRQGIKVTWPNSISSVVRQQQIKNFQLEAEYLSKCLHPNIPKVHEWFEENNTAYIVMEFIAGDSLAKILKTKGILTEASVEQYFIQIAEALKIVHQNNLIHRDIKPENIIIDKQDKAILIDFGATKEFIAGQTREMTTILTPGYAPLEQYSQKSKRWPATDFYAVCASMYELLTGELPSAAIERVSSDTLIPPRQLCFNISVSIEQVILTGMRIKVEERFQTADELIDALKGKFVSPSLRRSRQLAKEENLLAAAQSYEKCLANEPNNSEAAVELALVLIYINDSQAEVAANRAIQLKSNDSRGYGVLGLINCRKANWSAAVKYLQQAVNLSPNESWIQANLAWALAKYGDWQQAEIVASRAIKLDSNATFALGLQAWIAVNQKQLKPAIRAARIAINQSKQTHTKNFHQLQHWVYPCLIIALDKAVVTQQATDVDRCIQEFNSQVPDHSFASGFKAWKQAIIGLWTDAAANFELAKTQTQPPGWVLINLGITYEHLQNILEAIQIYEDYNQQFIPDAFVQFRLGTLFGRQGQWLQARLCLEKAIYLKPDYAEAYHNLAWVLLNITNEDNHIKNFREIWSAYRQAVELYVHQQKYLHAQNIKQAFQLVGVDLATVL